MVLILGCGAQKNPNGLAAFQDPLHHAMKNCIEDGDCILEIIPNSKLDLKSDEFGQLYGVIATGELMVFKLMYDRNVPKGIADANYTETYYFEIPKNTEKLVLKDRELAQINLVVDRRCFCKGTAGFFKILSGNLRLSIKKNELTLSGNFSHGSLPLVMTEIDEKVSLEP